MGNGPGKAFMMQVTPNVTQCIGCHSGGQMPTLTSYATLEAKYKVKPGSTSPLVTRGIHEGPALTPAQVTAIAGFLDTLP